MHIDQILALLMWWILGGMTILGTVWTLKKLRSVPPYMDAPFNLYPVSILKPLKGIDPDLRRNLESYFELSYPQFEIIFSVSKEHDPAVAVVRDLMSFYRHVRARLIIGDVELGPNPKVNNLVRSYEAAQYDWLLISDSNTRVSPQYLKRVVAHLDSGVGVMTAIVAGRDPRSFGGYLEATYLNTFYARWMVVAERFRKPCVIGKSMIFRRSVANRFGGIKTLAKYIAEDYMTGQAMKMLGMRVAIFCDPIEQPIGRYSLKDFWSRHLRWGRIRKAHAPFAFCSELACSAMAPAFLGGYALANLIAVSFWQVFCLHVLMHMLCDMMLIRKLKRELNLTDVAAWIIRELLVLPMWLHVLSGQTVMWRGQKLVIRPGGLVELPT